MPLERRNEHTKHYQGDVLTHDCQHCLPEIKISEVREHDRTRTYMQGESKFSFMKRIRMCVHTREPARTHAHVRRAHSTREYITYAHHTYTNTHDHLKSVGFRKRASMLSSDGIISTINATTAKTDRIATYWYTPALTLGISLGNKKSIIVIINI